MIPWMLVMLIALGSAVLAGAVISRNAARQVPAPAGVPLPPPMAPRFVVLIAIVAVAGPVAWVALTPTGMWAFAPLWLAAIWLPRVGRGRVSRRLGVNIALLYAAATAGTILIRAFVIG